MALVRGTRLCRRERAWSSVNPSRSTQRCSCRASSLHVTTRLKSHSQCRFDSNSNGASSTTASTLPANTLFTISQIILAPILVCVILLRRACQQGQRTAASRSADLFSIRRDGGCSNTSAPRAFRSIRPSLINKLLPATSCLPHLSATISRNAGVPESEQITRSTLACMRACAMPAAKTWSNNVPGDFVGINDTQASAVAAQDAAESRLARRDGARDSYNSDVPEQPQGRRCNAESQ